jgi:formylglycine-generating enzyme required for sulfatase activity
MNRRVVKRRSGEALTWIVVIVVVLCIAAGGLLYWQHHRTLERRGPKLTAATETLDLGKGVKLELVKINAGEFTMGSPSTEPDHDLSEEPQHKVTIAKPFYLGKFEITQAQWSVIRGNQSEFKGDDKRAADGISWGDANNWCKDMSQRLKVKMRLPTEAEWEYACRAGTTTPFAFGAELKPDEANFKLTNVGKTSVVGSYKPNAWGLYDMHGNVWEWCQDTLQPDYTGAPADGSAWVDEKENKYNRVRRGGSWQETAANCRSAVRFGSPGDEKTPDMRNNQVGFRVVVEVSQ